MRIPNIKPRDFALGVQGEDGFESYFSTKHGLDTVDVKEIKIDRKMKRQLKAFRKSKG